MHPPRPKALGARAIATPLVVVALALLLASCGGDGRDSRPPRLLHGTRSELLELSDQAAAAQLGTRFARAYARTAYLRHPPRLPGVTTALADQLSQVAARVPEGRRHLRPRALKVSLEPTSRTSLRGSVQIGDGHSPPFSVGFAVEKRHSRWRVVSASPPS